VLKYRLLRLTNRLAADGEELVVYRFSEGPVGLASAFDLRVKLQELNCYGFWSKLKELVLPQGSGIPAILVPPGARLLIRDIPTDRQLEWHVRGGTQNAVFTILTDEANTFRDAIGFGNGTVVLLRRLVEGQRVRVLSVSSEEEQQLTPESGITMQTS
jgi:hypothetical protein